MCVHPNTPEYATCVQELPELTQHIASGQAPATAWLQRGEWLQLMGEVRGAIRDYDQALQRRDELTPEQLAHLYVRRGVCYRRSLKFDLAVEDLLRALALQPEKGYFWSCLGIARYYQGEIELALEALTRALELDPTQDERSWEMRALCYQALGEHDRAVEDFTRRLALDIPPYPLLYAYRAHSRLMLGQYDLAIADCDQGEAIDHHEDTFDLYWIRGHARFVQGQAAPALGDFSRAIALRHDLAELYLWRGLVYRALGDEAAAADDLTEFVQHHPDGGAKALHDLAGLFASAAQSTPRQWEAPRLQLSPVLAPAHL